jgi:2-polyprenyl-6-hydroxyphenyl methylase/3-demethylubiquinone-9 3-methyltransferase
LKSKAAPTLETLVGYFDPGTDKAYLATHQNRFLRTRDLAAHRWTWKCAEVLDVGAHWLHQSVLYARDGHKVVAVDQPAVLAKAAVTNTAERHGIRLLPVAELDHAGALEALDENSIDVVLFCEILEHLTFNPVAFWRALYRVLRPGGRIILTTPNYYEFGSLVQAAWRFVRGLGGGIRVEDVLLIKTTGPHWKEYSLGEIRRYFTLLSDDFVIGEARHFKTWSLASSSWRRRIRILLTRLLPLFQDSLYVEIDLPEKRAGITIEPGWSSRLTD